MRRVLGLGLLLCLTTAVWGASKQYVVLEAPLIFDNAIWTLSGLAAGAGRVSNQVDRGATAHASRYEWRCRFALAGPNTLDEVLEIYLITGDGTNVDGEVPTSNGALVSAKRSNLRQLGILIVDQTVNNTIMSVSGHVEVASRFLQLGLWNGTASALQVSATAHRCTLTPLALEQQ